MPSVLPRSIDYRELPSSLPSDIYSMTQILNPVNSKAAYTIVKPPAQQMDLLIPKVFIFLIKLLSYVV